MGLRDKYSQAILTAKNLRMQGSAEERDGKLYFKGTTQTQDEANHARVREEIGDLLFAATNIARHLKVEPEAALKLTNRKFRRRFRHIESRLDERGQTFDATSIDEMENLWQEAKAEPQKGTKEQKGTEKQR